MLTTRVSHRHAPFAIAHFGALAAQQDGWVPKELGQQAIPHFAATTAFLPTPITHTVSVATTGSEATRRAIERQIREQIAESLKPWPQKGLPVRAERGSSTTARSTLGPNSGKPRNSPDEQKAFSASFDVNRFRPRQT